MSVFSVTVKVYDNAGSILENVFGVYAITLSLSPSGVFAGTVSGNTSLGTITFSNIRILSAGSLQIVASSSGVTSALSSAIPITNSVYTVSAATSSEVSINFDLAVTVTLRGEDNNLFTGSGTVVLTCPTSFVGVSSLSNSSGVVVFSIYFSQTGSMTLTSTSNGKTSSVVVNVNSNILKITSYSPVSIYLAE